MNFIYELTYKINKTVTKLECNYNGNLSEKFSDKNMSVNITMELVEGCSRIKILLNTKIAFEVINSEISIRQNYDQDYKVFLNGFQTWSDSREVKINANTKKTNPIFKSIIAPFGDSNFYKRKKDVQPSWTYTYIRKKDKLSFFGSLNEDNGFTVFEHINADDLMVVKKDICGLVISGEYVMCDLYIGNGEENKIFDAYFKLFGAKPMEKKKYYGWNTAHILNDEISQEIIKENLENIEEANMAVDIFQIESGYERHIGDWLKLSDAFSGGMEALTSNIKSKNIIPSLWLAPFICEMESDIFINHASWIARDGNGAFIKAGYNSQWHGNFFVLDIYNDEVRLYLKDVFNTIISDWGFEMVKLDYLYAITQIKRSDKSRGEIMSDGIALLKGFVGDILMSTSGVPLGSVFGKTDFCSISSKISEKWETKLQRIINFRERNSTINAINTNVSRRQLNGRAFISDPDVFLLRSSNKGMTTKQKEMLFYVNHFFGGLIFTSDNIRNYGDWQKDFIEKSFKLKDFKLLKVEYNELLKVTGELDGVKLLYLINLQSTPVSETVEEIKRDMIMNRHDMKFFEI